jgi:hypothetical protein
LQKKTSPLDTIAEEISPDKMVKNIVQELNSEHQALESEKSPTPENNEEHKVDDSTIPLSDDRTIGPQNSNKPTLMKGILLRSEKFLRKNHKLTLRQSLHQGKSMATRLMIHKEVKPKATNNQPSKKSIRLPTLIKTCVTKGAMTM